MSIPLAAYETFSAPVTGTGPSGGTPRTRS
jgi:hypothetical protein